MMGGSGGGGGGGRLFSGHSSPTGLRKQVEEAEDRTRDDEFENGVATMIGDLLVDANNRDAVAIQRHIDEIVKALESEIDGEVDILFGGSIAKRTYVDGSKLMLTRWLFSIT